MKSRIFSKKPLSVFPGFGSKFLDFLSLSNNFSSSLELRKIAVPRTVMFDRYEFGATVAGFVDYGTATQNEFSKLLNSQ